MSAASDMIRIMILHGVHTVIWHAHGTVMVQNGTAQECGVIGPRLAEKSYDILTQDVPILLRAPAAENRYMAQYCGKFAAIFVHSLAKLLSYEISNRMK